MIRRSFLGQCEVIAADGAAHGPKHFLVWDTTRRPGRSAHQQVADLLALHAKQGCQTICFTVSRQMAELTARWAAEQAPGRSIVPYRAGYRPEDRRRIEQALKDGTVNGVASTNALELGIDIGGLDAAILASYPGTMMSTWQQAGRAGRGTAAALVTLVAFEGPSISISPATPRSCSASPTSTLSSISTTLTSSTATSCAPPPSSPSATAMRHASVRSFPMRSPTGNRRGGCPRRQPAGSTAVGDGPLSRCRWMRSTPAA